jgi:hypothetical protein
MNIKELKNVVEQVVKETLRERTERNISKNLDSMLSLSKPSDSKEHYERLFHQQELMRDVFRGSIGENQNVVLSEINNDQWEEKNPNSFMKSLYSSKRAQFLSPYTEAEFSQMGLYKLKNHSIGFAIKKDGDIIAVHNNSDYSGLGSAMMAAAIRNGGSKLDHFDGFLTGLYNANGFSKIVHKDLWNEEYAPTGWKYEPVDIFSTKTSAYANLPQIKQIQQSSKSEKDLIKSRELSVPLVHAVQNYKTGRPSIIYRAL